MVKHAIRCGRWLGEYRRADAVSFLRRPREHVNWGKWGVAGAGTVLVGMILSPVISQCDSSPTIQQPIVRYKSFNDLQMKYQIGGVIGEGSFAVVKVGVDLASKEKVAIKEICKKGNHPGVLENEIDIMSNTGPHRSIVSLREVFDSPEKIYLVLDFAEGGELIDAIIREGQMTEKAASEMFNEVVEGVAHMHSKGFVHLDIKPENLLLTQDRHLKISDFGLSIDLKNCIGKLQVECGTPAYAAPELLDHKDFNETVDVWALGCVLYIMLCGIHPFDPKAKSTDEQMQNSAKNGDYDTENKSYRLLSSEAKDLISHMLDPNPKTRFGTQQVLRHQWLCISVVEKPQENSKPGILDWLQGQAWASQPRLNMD